MAPLQARSPRLRHAGRWPKRLDGAW